MESKITDSDRLQETVNRIWDDRENRDRAVNGWPTVVALANEIDKTESWAREVIREHGDEIEHEPSLSIGEKTREIATFAPSDKVGEGDAWS